MSDHHWSNPSGGTGQPPQQGWAAPSRPGQYAPPPGYGPPPAGYGAPGQPPQYGGPPPGHGQQPQFGPGPGYPGGGIPLAPKPGVIPLRALTVGDIFGGSIATMRGNPGATMGLSLLITFASLVPFIGLSIAVDQISTGSGAAQEAVSSLVALGGVTIYLISYFLLIGMLISVVSQAVLGRRVTIGQTWRAVKGRVWGLLGTILVIGLVMVIPFVAALVLSLLLAMASPDAAGAAFGVLAIVVVLPAMVFLYIKLLFAMAVAVLEKQGPIASIKRSWALTKDQWWRVFGIVVLTHFVLWVVQSALVMIASLVISGVAIGAGAVDPALGVGISMALLLAVMTALIAAIVPFLANVVGLLYIDQRIRKEALDVTLMASAQQPGSP